MPHVSSSNSRGYTLVEMVVTLAIVSILASMALPYARMIHVRNQEMELRHSLRVIRTAIDAFHADWEQGAINKLQGYASKEGYPKELTILVEGVDLSGKINRRKKYLRRIPVDPFAEQTLPAAEQWLYIGYRDEPDTEQWNGQDIYDVRSRSDRQALDKSNYRDW